MTITNYENEQPIHWYTISYRWLALSSAIAVTVTAVLTWWCIATDDEITDAKPVPLWPPWERFISGCVLIRTNIIIHPEIDNRV